MANVNLILDYLKMRWEMQENSAKFDKQFFVYVPTTAQIPKTMKENRTSQISQRR